MPSLTKLYQQAFQELFLPEGFKVHGKGFYRLCDDVLQIFYMRGYQGSYDFCFNIFPASLGVDELYLEIYDISYFRTQCFGWWPKQQLLDAGFSEAVALTVKHVLPVFRRGTDSTSAYLALTDLERQIYSIGVIMNNFSFVLLCLQAGDYAQAEKHMAAIIAQNVSALVGKPNREEAEIRIAERKILLSRIHERDTKYWDPILDKGRKVTMDFLASLEPKRRRKAPEV